MNNKMRILSLLLIMGFVSSCQGHEEAAGKLHNSGAQNQEIREKQNVSGIRERKQTASSIIVECGERTLSFLVVRDDSGQWIKVSERDVATKVIRLPDQNEFNGFSMNWLKPREKGFELSVEYGSRFYFQKDFEFNCDNNNLILGKIRVTKFDKHNPETTWEESSETVSPKVPFETFELRQYLTFK